MKMKLAWLVLPLIACDQAAAAGFDCSLSTLNETEHAICDTPYLNGLDNVANKLYSSALVNSLARGTLITDQNRWRKTRNACGKDLNCIKDTYIQRNSILGEINKFLPVAQVFPNFIDPPFEHDITNPNGFIIRDSPWDVKLLFNPDRQADLLGLTQGYWKILHHLEVNGDLLLFFAVQTQRISYVVMISQINMQSAIIEAYDSEAKYAPSINTVKTSNEDFVFHVENRYDPSQKQLTSAYYRISANRAMKFTPEKIAPPDDVKQDQTWTGYCGDSPCDSTMLSPDKKWRLASADDVVKNKNEGVFYFPAERPDLGTNVFTTLPDDKDEAFSYSRNFAWGNKDAFFFDNDGALACIWKTDINNKTTERILPVEGLKKPYYIRYNNRDYVLSRYVADDDRDDDLSGFYIATADK